MLKKTLLAATLATGFAFGATLPAYAETSDEPMRLAQMRRSEPRAQAQRRDQGQAVIAGVSSLVVPGLGQVLFNQEIVKGVVHFVGAIGLWSLPRFVPLGGLEGIYYAVPVLWHAYSGYDAYTVAGGTRLVALPGEPLQAWSFDQQVQAFHPTSGELSHLQLTSSQILD